MLQIKGQMNIQKKRPRFNEDVDEEIKSITASQKGKINILGSRNPKLPSDGRSYISNSLRSGVSASLASKHKIPTLNDRLSAANKSIGQASSSHFKGTRSSLPNEDMQRQIERQRASQVALEKPNQQDADNAAEDEPNHGTVLKGAIIDDRDLMMNTDELKDVVNDICLSTHDKPLVKFDCDSASEVSFNTNTSSFLKNPSTINTVASSKLEMQLNFLAKQLELERQRRERLQDTVEVMAKSCKKCRRVVGKKSPRTKRQGCKERKM